MSSDYEVRERQKRQLGTLLKLKKANAGSAVVGLQEAIMDEVTVMEKEDVSWVEKIVGIQAL